MALSDARQCTAKAKRTGQRCKNPAVRGYTVCRMHGAGSPRQGRPGGRPIIHGRYSKVLPADLAQRYDIARTDPDLLALRDEIALIEARTNEVLMKLSEGTEENHDSDTVWLEILGLFERRRKLVESERRRMVELHQVITAERAMLLISALVDCVRRHIDDPKIMGAIAADIRGLLAEPGGHIVGKTPTDNSVESGASEPAGMDAQTS